MKSAPLFAAALLPATAGHGDGQGRDVLYHRRRQVSVRVRFNRQRWQLRHFRTGKPSFSLVMDGPGAARSLRPTRQAGGRRCRDRYKRSTDRPGLLGQRRYEHTDLRVVVSAPGDSGGANANSKRHAGGMADGHRARCGAAAGRRRGCGIHALRGAAASHLRRQWRSDLAARPGDPARRHRPPSGTRRSARPNRSSAGNPRARLRDLSTRQISS